MKTVVSLTSYPKRIGKVYKVIESLWEQTVQADAILLYLSLDEFQKGKEDLPEDLRRMEGNHGFQIKWVKGNLKSHKKYYYALQEYQDSVVITVDDDVMYAQTMLSDLMESFRRFPQAISARKVRIMFRRRTELERYVKWDRYPKEYQNVPRKDICAIGVGGILYPPGTGNERWFIKEEITSMASEQDDLWLKYNEIVDDISVVYTPAVQDDISIEESQKENLSAQNLYCDKNDRCMEALSAMIEKRDSECFHAWFCGLMYRSEYIALKKKYFYRIFSTALNKVENMPVYLYGAGKRAEYVLEILTALTLTGRITAAVVSDRTGNPTSLKGLKVKELKEIRKDKQFGLILGISERYRSQVIGNLQEYDYQYIDLDIRSVGRYMDEFCR